MFADDHTGLVLQGGGMRGVFTAGVLDCFMDHHLLFPYVIGVSAGASNGISYISGQRGRAKFSNIDALRLHPYVGWKTFLHGKGFFDLNYLFGEYPQQYIKFDYDAYSRSPQRFVMVASNCLTGQPVYLEEKSNGDRLLQMCRASCSLPVLSSETYVDGVPLLDGGICDPIPLAHSISEGFHQNVVVLTRNLHYRKPNRDFFLSHFFYRRYPAIREQLRLSYDTYNRQMDFVEKMEREGSVFVIRPDHPIEVGRLERDTAKLTALYEEGYRCAELYFRS